MCVLLPVCLFPHFFHCLPVFPRSILQFKSAEKSDLFCSWKAVTFCIPGTVYLDDVCFLSCSCLFCTFSPTGCLLFLCGRGCAFAFSNEGTLASLSGAVDTQSHRAPGIRLTSFSLISLREVGYSRFQPRVYWL